MDYQKKKLLSQSVGFLQATLTLTSDFLRSLKDHDVLTEEEKSTVQKDETSSGKVLELICLLKRKDNRTFSKFIEVLEKHRCTAAAQLLKHKTVDKGLVKGKSKIEMDVSEKAKADERTVRFLENSLKDVSINGQMINDLALNLVPRQMHKDEVSELQDKIASLQRQLKAKAPLTRTNTSTDMRTSPDSGRPQTGGSSGSSSHIGDKGSPPIWDVPTQKEEFETMLRYKDDIIKRNDMEYKKLKSMLEDTQNHLDSVLDINNQYLLIISQFNAMQRTGATPRAGEKDRAIAELESQLAEANQKIDELTEDMDKVAGQLQLEQSEVDKLKKREKKYKDLLGLDVRANEHDIERQIERLLQEGNMSKSELDKIQRELRKIMSEKTLLDDRITTLSREKEKIEFHLRQQELTIKKMKRMKAASHTIQAAENLLAIQEQGPGVQMRLPSIGRPPSSIGLSAIKGSRTSRQYCVFCRTEYEPLKSAHCRIHFRALRDGKWTCCRDDCHRGAGCLQVPHFYMEITVDKKLFLTDGARYWEI